MSAGVLAREGELRPAAAKGFSASEIGTFKDNKAAPIHRWFQYPAGFSFHAVERALDTFAIGPGRTVLDPFAGAGTTLVAC